MIFLCFSSKDRDSIAESIYYHLNNIGMPVWYDRKEILMGDNRNYKNFIEGVDSCEYGIIVLSPNSIASTCANEEIELMQKKYEEKTMYIFPVFYNILASEIPQKYSWMKELVYKELDITKDSRGLCNHVICKVLKDIIVKESRYQSMIEISKVASGFLKALTVDYLQIDGNNFNSRIAILYAGILYLNNIEEKQLPFYCNKAASYIFSETKLNLTVDLRDTTILEYLFIIAFNHCL